MPKKSSGNRALERWTEFSDELHRRVPHLSAWYGEEESFSELRIKAKADGTMLAIAKGFGPDGGPVVCFGSGYGLVACLMAIDATIQGGHWRVDKPWPNKGK